MKWEYLRLTWSYDGKKWGADWLVGKSIHDGVDLCGARGWELVSFDCAEAVEVFWFKRPLKDSSEQSI